MAMIILMACRGPKTTASMNDADDSHWQNPEILPRDHPGIISINRAFGHGGPEQEDRQGLGAFLERMNERFAQSGIDRETASDIYELLHASGMLFNEAVGMPDPEAEPKRESPDDLKKRIALRLRPDDSYEIFFVRTGCGYTYFYGYFDLPDEPSALDLTPAEVWRASVPC